MSLTLFGVDVSRFRIPVWAEVPQSVRIGITRSNVGLEPDKTYDEQRTGIITTARNFGAYCVLSPWADPLETFKLYWGKTKDHLETWPIVDVELPYESVAAGTKALKAIINAVLAKAPKVIIYSGAWFLDSNMDLSDPFFKNPRILWWLAAYPLAAMTFEQAVAMYPKHLSLSLPKYVLIENVIGWQFTSNLAPKLKMTDGKMMGVDGNLFDVRMLVGEPIPAPIDPPPDPGEPFVSVVIGRFEYPMKFRKGPGTVNQSLGGADVGSEFIILDETFVETVATKELWVKVSPTGLWVCAQQLFKSSGRTTVYVTTRSAKFNGRILF